jgi:hypothetical protein
MNLLLLVKSTDYSSGEETMGAEVHYELLWERCSGTI